MQEHGYLQPTN